MKKLINLFDNSQKIKFILLIFFMLIASFLELLGLGMVLLVLNSFLGINDNNFEIINDFVNFFSETDFNFEMILFIIFM